MLDALIELHAPSPANVRTLAKAPWDATLRKGQAGRSDPCGKGCGGRGWGEVRVERSKLRSERGQATVEFALVLPMVLLVLVGLIAFGKAFNYWINLNHIANEGARWAVVDKVPPYTAAGANNAAKTGTNVTACLLANYIASQASTTDLQGKIAPGYTGACGVATAIPNGWNITVACKNTGGVAPNIGDPATVTVAAPYKLPASGFLKLFGGSGVITLQGKATMRLEQVPNWAATCSP
jgi:Flp pilus assembly protein TadG